MTAAYPLSWPAGRPRTPLHRRKTAAFGTRGRSATGTKQALTVAEALARLQLQLDNLGARLPVISTNVETRLDGLPRSGAREPTDPGACLYFQLGGKPHAMPCDTYTKVADNIAAIAAHIEATRAIERHGVATVAEMFAGFAALPAPGATRPWTVVFGVNDRAGITPSVIEAAYRELAKRAHPDAGGSHEKMAELNAARDAALKEIGS